MSKVERKEYHETKIMKTRSPVRGGTHRGSAQDLAEFDNNLGKYLLIRVDVREEIDFFISNFLVYVFWCVF